MVQKFTWNVRIYYEDTDAGGIVFYANYLKFFERARTEWLRTTGVNQQSLVQSHGIIFVVQKTAVDYHAPAKLDDELKLTVVVERQGRASIQFVQEAWRINGTQEQLLTSGRVTVACVNAESLRPTVIPNEILAKLKNLE